ncbi:MAG: hypothetical protein ABI134_10205 [Byssovorax sp.]
MSRPSAPSRPVLARPPELRTKGVSLLSFVTTLRALHGSDAAERTLDGLPDDVCKALREGLVVASSWYPLAWHRAMHASAQRACKASPELARSIGFHGTQADFRGVYRFVASLIAPDRLLRISPRVWSNYFDGGKVAVDEHYSGKVQTSFSECHGFNRSLWENTIGGSLAVLDIAGATNVRTRILRGGGDGDDQLELELTWT